MGVEKQETFCSAEGDLTRVATLKPHSLSHPSKTRCERYHKPQKSSCFCMSRRNKAWWQLQINMQMLPAAWYTAELKGSVTKVLANLRVTEPGVMFV